LSALRSIVLQFGSLPILSQQIIVTFPWFIPNGIILIICTSRDSDVTNYEDRFWLVISYCVTLFVAIVCLLFIFYYSLISDEIRIEGLESKVTEKMELKDILHDISFKEAAVEKKKFMNEMLDTYEGDQRYENKLKSNAGETETDNSDDIVTNFNIVKEESHATQIQENENVNPELIVVDTDINGAGSNNDAHVDTDAIHDIMYDNVGGGDGIFGTSADQNQETLKSNANKAPKRKKSVRKPTKKRRKSVVKVKKNK